MAEQENISHTYWCHTCDESVSLVSQHSMIAKDCPNCLGHSLEIMDSPVILSHSLSLQYLNDVFLCRLSPHLNSEAEGSRAASSAIITIPSMLDVNLDACAVCKDDFVPGADANRLPCGHVYHPGCILPWLAQHDSCPLCRYRVPSSREEEVPLEVVFGAEEDADWANYAVTLSHIARKHNVLVSNEGGPSGEGLSSG